MALAAMLLTLGTVDPRPNLERSQRRLAAVLEGDPACPAILYEQYDTEVRQRFSIAHELGHYSLHAQRTESSAAWAYRRCTQAKVDSEDTTDGNSADDVEAEADAFAGAFLLPAAALQDDIAQFGVCVAFLAERYAVSEATARRRLKTLEVVTT
ncbi:MAG: ImmA/IrrE family metallo-endopeptidase [Ktedonobacterales bacterium]